MGIFHFLNVGQGDCSIIQHPSGHVTVMDVNHAKPLADIQNFLGMILKENYNQKSNPTNPIEYMHERGINDVFRFILSHPEMDHMGGIKAFFDTFAPTNFWDSDNNCVKDDWNGGPHSKDDWDFYRSIRDGRNTCTKRLVLYSGSRGKYYNEGADGSGGGDGLYVLAPTPALVSAANACGDYNDSSYVILYRSNAGRILLAGDSHDATWEHILQHHEADVAEVEVLLAPHHGRHSDRSFDFLDVVRPKLTLFGNAASEYLAYAEWNRRGLPIITNNQAGDVIIDTSGAAMSIFVTNEKFARSRNPLTFFDLTKKAWHLGTLPAPARRFPNALTGVR